MLLIRNVIYTKCYLYEMLPIQNVTYTNVTIRKFTRQNVTIRKCTIRNVTDPLKQNSFLIFIFILKRCITF